VDINAKGKPALQDFDTPSINVLHPTYLEKVQKWWILLLHVLKEFSVPRGRIVLIQMDSHTGIESLHEPYFTFGYHSQLIDLYQDWLKNKYLILSAVNVMYRSEYSDFSQIKPPLKPKTKALLPVAAYLDWLEFKEWQSTQYLLTLGDMMQSAEITIPRLISLNSYKSPANASFIRTLFRDELSILMGYEFHPGVFTSQVNCHCYVNFHVEWMKDHLPNPPFLSNVQASHFNSEWDPIQLHNLLRMSLAHGARSFLVRMPSPLLNEKLAPPIEKMRDAMLTEFAQVLRVHKKTILSSKKTYDPLSVAYYHPVTRFKSFDSPINAESFGFPIHYATLKYYYKYILQLLTKYFVQYDVIDLQTITQEDLQSKPFVLLYYIGWMEHLVMVKLVEYVKNGGVVLSFGDIPMKNAFFEEDLTLHQIYQARCEGEHPPDTLFRWAGAAPFHNLSAVKYLCSYALEDPDHTHILADNRTQSENHPSIFAFSRHIEQGVIIHSGILVSSDVPSITFLEALLEEAKFPIRNMSVTQECVAIQQVADSEERLLLVGNLYAEPLESLSFSFFNPHATQYSALLEIDDITLPPHIFHLWHAHKSITQHIHLIYITAEIYAISEHPRRISARYYGLNEFQMALRVSSSPAPSIRIISGEGEVSEQMQKDGKYKEIIIKSHTQIQFEVVLADNLAEVVFFSIEKNPILGA
ncbi:MAG: beta-galactosidase, partial [Promethearchaeota archaeon]